MALQRIDNVGVVVDDLPTTTEFFRELGLEPEGQATVEGDGAGRVTGLGDQRVEIAGDARARNRAAELHSAR
jgi:catechol 2,3-dioxygenase-like lactoylglutathione lyase family enzyme